MFLSFEEMDRISRVEKASYWFVEMCKVLGRYHILLFFL